MDKSDIPVIWRDILEDLQQKFPKAILAGGALRDLWCGHTVKDLDYFVVGEEPLRNWSGFYENSGTFDYEGMEYVNGVQLFLGGPLPVNLIFCNDWETTENFLKTFDFGINQIAFDGKEVIATNAFHWDYKHSLFTLYHGDRYDRSLTRFNRINERYGWEMVLAEGVKKTTTPNNMDIPF